MADQQIIILQALSYALESAGVCSLFNKKGVQGLFPLSASGKVAAKYCLENRLLKVVEQSTKPFTEMVKITCWGIRSVMEGIKIDKLLENAAAIIESSGEKGLNKSGTDDAVFYHSLEKTAGLIALKLGAPIAEDFNSTSKHILILLKEWSDAGRAGDCQLYYLYQQLSSRCSGVTPGAFHDALRNLRHKKLVELHPWTGPLYEIPKPELALMAGHEIACYASLGPAAVFNPDDSSFALCSAG
ncbi:MAG: hypothetical protein EBT92_00160 [Planctomycetes bacterium]|nr:hypothetical protein [Planctomycetota bacterium]NBY00497.1 hypothetical protein [Planctomycetota bacterium]